jgi:hypothetical protein
MQKRTSRGQIIDFEALQAAQGDVSAVGNMNTDGNGNVLGPGGEVIETNENRVRKYLRDNPSTSVEQVSLDTSQPIASSTAGADVVQTKTAKTEAENVRTAKTKVQPDPEPAPEQPSEFDEPEDIEPLGFNEVMQDNGDIEMVPYYKEEDKA